LPGLTEEEEKQMEKLNPARPMEQHEKNQEEQFFKRKQASDVDETSLKRRNV